MIAMWPLPDWILETTNGWAALMLPWVIWTATRYLIRRRGEFLYFWNFYRNSKLAISLLMLVCGVEIRTAVAWIVRHANAHGYWLDGPALVIVPVVYTCGAAMIVIGAACWARVANDMPVSSAKTWIVVGASFAASYWLALFSNL